MKQKIILILFVFFSFSYLQLQAYTQVDLRLFYDRLYVKIENKTGKQDQKILPVLFSVDEKLKTVLKTTQHTKNKVILNTLLSLNKEKIIFIQNKQQNTLTQNIS
jgi:hypothetical protein